MPPLTKLDPYQGKSQFLAALGDREYNDLWPLMELVSLKAGTVLYMHGDSARYLYFPLDACISIITTVQDGRGVEVALIGSEGLAGIWAALGSKTNWHEAVIQLPGDCLRLKVDLFRAQMKVRNSLLDHVHRYRCNWTAKLN